MSTRTVTLELTEDEHRALRKLLDLVRGESVRRRAARVATDFLERWAARMEVLDVEALDAGGMARWLLAAAIVQRLALGLDVPPDLVDLLGSWDREDQEPA